MSFSFKGFVDSISQSFSTIGGSSTHASDPSMEAGPSVVNERVVLKLKGYFELAKEEIDKAVKAEEWGLSDDAIAHYRNAHRIMLEAKSARLPAALSSSEQSQVKAYQQKIAKWQSQVSERLQVLSRREGTSTVPNEATSINNVNTIVSSAPSGARRATMQNSSSFRSSNLAAGNKTDLTPSAARRATLQNSSSFRISNLATGNKKDLNGGSKPFQEAGGSHDHKLVEMINTAIVDRSPAVKWDDVAGLSKAKQTLLEMVILPTKRRDLFTGLRKPARGLLLFGPPGNGKTMLAKAVASESDATFFNVSASSLTSKWVGEGEKLVRTLFMVAISRQPSVIFMDEVKRIYVPLPDENVRRLLLKNQLKGQAFSLPGSDLERLVRETDGYSGSDLQALCEEAAMMPIRELGPKHILTIKPNQLRPLRYDDFKNAMDVIRPSLQKSRWEELEQWNKEFGSN